MHDDRGEPRHRHSASRFPDRAIRSEVDFGALADLVPACTLQTQS